MLLQCFSNAFPRLFQGFEKWVLEAAGSRQEVVAEKACQARARWIAKPERERVGQGRAKAKHGMAWHGVGAQVLVGPGVPYTAVYGCFTQPR